MSIVEREVADTVRVTDNPKKLKPLQFISTSISNQYSERVTYPMEIIMRKELTAIAR